MGFVVAIILSLIMLIVLIGGAYMYDAIEWYIQPEETELEAKARNIKERLRWLKSNMVE